MVHLTPRDRQLIDQQGWCEKLSVEPYVRLGNSYVLSHIPAGGCVFLTDDGKCRIHLEHGASQKPLACQLYPLTLEPHEESLQAGIRFDCPTVARNGGTVVTSYQSQIQQLANELTTALGGSFPGSERPVEFVRGRSMPRQIVDEIVEKIDAWLSQSQRPLQQRLMGLLDLVQTLENAKLQRMSDEQVGELIAMLLQDMPNVINERDDSLIAPPTSRQLKLFRQTIYSYCEHITFGQARASLFRAWRYRLDQLQRAKIMMAGVGAIPQLGPQSAYMTFEQVDAVTLQTGAQQACGELMTRYLRSRILTQATFGNGFYGWPVLDGLQAQLLGVAVLGWLVRYVAAASQRTTYGIEDLVQAIGMLDRGAGRVRELGRRTASLRQTYLYQDDGLKKILKLYPVVD